MYQLFQECCYEGEQRNGVGAGGEGEIKGG